jgi:hypothetical protein
MTEVFLWNQDTGDASGESTSYSTGVINDAASQFPSPELILMHSTIDSTAYDVAPYAVGTLQRAGYQLVAVDTCLGDDGEWPYEYVGEPGTPDGSWTC